MADRGEATPSSGQSLARWALLIALGSAIALPYSARNSGEPQRAAEGTASAASAGGTSAGASPSRRDDETAHTDALTLLGDFIGLDVSEPAMLGDAARSAATLVGG